MSSASKKASKDVKKRSSKRHHRSKSVKDEAQPPVDALVELEVAGPEKSAYEHGLQRYLKEAPSFLDKTEILTPDALPAEKTCFRRNLPGILFASLVLLFTIVVFVEVADKGGGAETNFFYPTPETTTVAGNSTDVNTIEGILIEGRRQQLFAPNQEAREERSAKQGVIEEN